MVPDLPDHSLAAGLFVTHCQIWSFIHETVTDPNEGYPVKPAPSLESNLKFKFEGNRTQVAGS